MSREQPQRASDQRERALYAWAETALGEAIVAWEAVSVDASFRRYFRLRMAERSYIVMDAPPGREDCGPFVRVASLMAAAGVHVPRIVAADMKVGFLLLSDLGSRRYLEVLHADNADDLFSDAIDALIRWQLASRPDVLPEYDETLLRRELALFEEWYVGAHLGIRLDSRAHEQLEHICALAVERAIAQPRVFVHRDYMPRNLMVSEPNPGVLDFQDAVHGPITYDILSLFKDAFVSWDEGRVLEWLTHYWRRARHAGLPVQADFDDFRADWEYMGVQRHLKVVGIFSRIAHRDGKPIYLADIPRFLGYIRGVARRHASLRPLLDMLDDLPVAAS